MTSDAKSPQSPSRRAVTWLVRRKWRLTRAHTLGAQVAVIDSADRFLLIRHGYRPGWHFPGGGVEFGETVLDAAIRELEEETGVIPDAALSLFGIYNNAKNFPGDQIVLYTLRAYRQPRLPAPGFEVAEQAFFAPDRLPPAVTEGTARRIAEIVAGAPQSALW